MADDSLATRANPRRLMTDPIRTQPHVLPEKPQPSDISPDSFLPLAVAIAVLIAGFSVPLFHLGKLALSEDLYSHILLIPFVSLYLIWGKRPGLPGKTGSAKGLSLTLIAAGLLVLLLSGTTAISGTGPSEENYLAPKILAFLLLLNGTCAWFLGSVRMRALAFPLAFLIFMVPFPTAVRHGLETFLQHGSAAVAHVLFKVRGTPVFYHDLVFRLPGISLEVAPECSGIRSSLALFITSVLAGYFFLRTPWKIAVLSLAVIPLALLRNGFRVFTIGELCVRVSPDMIDSYIHHKGGPIFFALSLIPFFFLLRFLFKSERRGSKNAAPQS